MNEYVINVRYKVQIIFLNDHFLKLQMCSILNEATPTDWESQVAFRLWYVVFMYCATGDIKILIMQMYANEPC